MIAKMQIWRCPFSCLCLCFPCVGDRAFAPPQSFTRLAEQVLQANKKDLDLLRTSLTDELNLTALEEEEGICDGTADSQKACWC